MRKIVRQQKRLIFYQPLVAQKPMFRFIFPTDNSVKHSRPFCISTEVSRMVHEGLKLHGIIQDPKDVA